MKARPPVASPPIRAIDVGFFLAIPAFGMVVALGVIEVHGESQNRGAGPRQLSGQLLERLEGCFDPNHQGPNLTYWLKDSHSFSVSELDLSAMDISKLKPRSKAKAAGHDPANYAWTQIFRPEGTTKSGASSWTAYAYTKGNVSVYCYPFTGPNFDGLVHERGPNFGLYHSAIATVTITSPSADYASWAGNFPSFDTDAGMDLDPDRDGLINLVEFAFGTDPTHGWISPLAVDCAQLGEPLVWAVDGGNSFELLDARRIQGGPICTPQFSSNLSSFNDSSETPAVIVGSSPADPDYEIAKVPYAPNARFGQIRIDPQP
jgi:hypothetical protein